MAKGKINKMRKKYEALDYQIKIMELQQRLEELKRSAPKLGFYSSRTY